MGMDRVAMDGNRILAAPGRGRPGLRGLCLALVFCLAIAQVISAAQTGKAVRHHKVAVEDPSSPPELTQAEAAIEKKDYATAEPLLKKVVERDGNNYAAWFDLGFLYNALGKSEDSISAYRKSVAAKPDVFESNLNLGLMLARAGTPDAEGILRKLVALHPNDASAHMQLGRMLAADGQNDGAIVELQSALKLDPNDTAAQRDLADLYVSAKKYDQAETQYRALLASHPNDAELHQGLGHALLEQRKFPEAQQELVNAIKLKPDLGSAYWDLAVAGNETKNYQLAIKALDDRAKFAPEMPLSYFLRATAYDHLRSKKQAAENYHRFLEVADGKFPDQEWQARHRLIAIEPTK